MPIAPFRKKPVANRRRRPRRKTGTKMTASKVRTIALTAVNKTREIKRLWGKINQTEDNNNVAVPTGTNVPGFLFSDGLNAYESSCLNLTHQGLENENRIGNIIQPVSFNLKGYGIIGTNTSDNANIYQSHVRVVCGFRRQSSLLTPSNGNLMMEGGVTAPLNFDYRDIINGFNWKEFRPFYDKTFRIAPISQKADNFTNPYTKNYFHFNIKHKFPMNEKLVSLEDDLGQTTNLYNNKNIYVMFIVRQMNNDNDLILNAPLEIFANSMFAFHDA
jgi:hypothetical protein